LRFDDGRHSRHQLLHGDRSQFEAVLHCERCEMRTKRRIPYDASAAVIPTFTGTGDIEAAVGTGTETTAFFGPRLRTSSKRMRSSNSDGACIPLGRNRSDARSLSHILILPEKMMAGVSGDSALIAWTSSAPSRPGIIRSARIRSAPWERKANNASAPLVQATTA